MDGRMFQSLCVSYLKVAATAFDYARRVPWIFSPVVLIIALFYASALVPIALLFGLLSVLDWLGSATDMLRRSIFNFMDAQSHAVDASLFSFLLRPIVLVVVAPVFFLSVIIPKFSNNMAEEIIVDELSGAGIFKNISALFFRAARQLFAYVSKSPLLLMPVVAIIAMNYAVLLMMAGSLFVMLIPIDWISKFIDGTRRMTVNFVERQQINARRGFVSFLFIPTMLIVMTPVILVVLLVPKFSSSFDTA